MIIYLLIAAIWLIMGFISYSGILAYWMTEAPPETNAEYREHLGFSIFCGLFGPIGFFVTLFYTGFYVRGFRFK